MNIQMNKLTALIARLMDETFNTQDQDQKVRLAATEYRARECLKVIRNRLAICN